MEVLHRASNLIFYIQVYKKGINERNVENESQGHRQGPSERHQQENRQWQLTFNNPAEHGFTHDAITAAIENLASVVYWCMCDEIGSEGTYHTHLYICFQNPKAHTVIANAFPGAHRENVKGTSQQNRDYVLKDGEKYNKQPDGTYDYVDGSGKRHQGTNYSDTFLEWGELPHEHQGKNKDVEKILALLKDGADNLEIVDQVPSAMLNLDKVERTRSMYRDKQFAETWRDLEVVYIFGPTGAGKTRSVMDTYGAIKGSPADPDCDALANCVGYAVGRFNEIGGWGRCKYLSPVNAENFIQYKGGLEVSQTPQLGACMVWQKGATLSDADGAGHVAIVEQVVSDTEVMTSESAYGGKAFWTQTRKKGTDGNWGQGSGYKFLGFILNPAPCCTGAAAATQPSTGGCTAAGGSTTGETVYTVAAGDTLSKIAAKYGTTYQALTAYNGIANPNRIHVGQQIRIPGPGIHTGSRVQVNSGARTYTGGGLASFVYTTVYEVIQINGDRVVIGLNGKTTAAMNVKDLTLA